MVERWNALLSAAHGLLWFGILGYRTMNAGHVVIQRHWIREYQ